MESPERVFVGVITEVVFAQEQSSLDNILLTGYSRFKTSCKQTWKTKKNKNG